MQKGKIKKQYNSKYFRFALDLWYNLYNMALVQDLEMYLLWCLFFYICHHSLFYIRPTYTVLITKCAAD